MNLFFGNAQQQSVLWTPVQLGADLLVDLDAAAPGSVVYNGSNQVEAWHSINGATTVASQSTNANKPTFSTTSWDGARPSVTYNGNQYLVIPAFTVTNFSLFIVYEETNITTNDVRAIVMKRLNTSSSYLFFFGFNTNARNITIDQNGTSSPARWNTTHLPVINTKYMYSYIRPLAGTNRTFFSNGTMIASNATNANVSNNSQLVLGGDNTQASRGLIGKISEFVMVNNNMSAVNRQKMEGYLAYKWGITGSLPNDHPYKFVQPTV